MACQASTPAAYSSASRGSTARTNKARPPKRVVDQNDGSECVFGASPALTSLNGLVVADANGFVVVAVEVGVVGTSVVAPPVSAACSSATWVYCCALGAPRVGVGSNSTHPCPLMYTSGHACACRP